MDSCNSGSIQSSSGGDEEYDSRAESLSAFLNLTGQMNGPMSNPPSAPQKPPPLPPHHHHHPNSSMYDPLSNFFNTSSTPLANPNPLLNLEPLWSKTRISDPSCTEISPVYGSPSPPVPFPPVPENTTPRDASSSSAAITTTTTTITEQNQTTHVVRNPKKRSRASRRAPTTVLTTDTTNFRAMVQEFTGIPAPPFTSSSPFARSRLDLFGTPSCMRYNPLDASQPPPYLLRPFAQKFHPTPPPFASSSSSPSSSVSKSTSTSYQVPNPILAFDQSLLQSHPNYPLAISAIRGSKAQALIENPSNDSNLKTGFLDDQFGLNQTELILPNLPPRNGNGPVSWAAGVGSGDGDQSHMRSVNGSNYSKLNLSASLSHGSGKVLARGEGSMESWICSSD